MKFLILIIGLTFGTIVQSQESNDISHIKRELDYKLQTWNDSQKQDFHRSLIKVLEKWSWKTNYKDKVIQEKFTLLYLNPNFLDFIFPRANALSAQDAYLLCNYGGWMSALDDAGNCLAPWSKSIRKHEVLQEFGDFYTGRYSCGGKGKFRCNPTVFGGGKDGKGFCVNTNDRDPNMATSDCLKNLEERGEKGLQEELIADPKKATNYIAMAAETIRYCNDYEGKALYCEKLIDSFNNTTATTLSCIQGSSLYPFLPNVVSPINEDDIDKITGGLVSDYKKYQEELEKRQQVALDANAALIKKGIEQYSKSDKTTAMIKKMRKNLTRCLIDSCDDISGVKPEGPKPKTKSVRKCLRYVKFGMLGKNSYLNNYPGTVNAVHSGEFLSNAGFTNLMDNPSFASMTPESAPVGAVIVYRKVGGNKGRPGHIEIKGSDSEYLSDFVNSSPTRVGGKRIPIGIYVKVPKDIKKDLVEVPES